MPNLTQKQLDEILKSIPASKREEIIRLNGLDKKEVEVEEKEDNVTPNIKFPKKKTISVQEVVNYSTKSKEMDIFIQENPNNWAYLIAQEINRINKNKPNKNNNVNIKSSYVLKEDKKGYSKEDIPLVKKSNIQKKTERNENPPKKDYLKPLQTTNFMKGLTYFLIILFTFVLIKGCMDKVFYSIIRDKDIPVEKTEQHHDSDAPKPLLY